MTVWFWNSAASQMSQPGDEWTGGGSSLVVARTISVSRLQTGKSGSGLKQSKGDSEDFSSGGNFLWQGVS